MYTVTLSTLRAIAFRQTRWAVRGSRSAQRAYRRWQPTQHPYGFLTAYNLLTNTWDRPVEIGDSQSRGDFILYDGELYLFYAPINREHIGIIKIDTDNIENSRVVLQAKMHTSCFYPFVQFFADGELAMSYTIARKHIRLARFTLRKYLDK